MCVILYKPIGEKLPNRNILKAMWDKNHDGAGFMWKDYNGTIHYRKGYFSFKKLYRDIKSVYSRNIEMAVHCRIATSGGINKGMCHPFPMVANGLTMKSSSMDSNSTPFVMHNGMINTKFVDNLSDTCSYIINSLVPRYKKDKIFFYNPIMETKIKNEIGYSKLLIFSPKTDAKMIGNWEEYNGCYYSNLYFMAWTYGNSYSSCRKSNLKKNISDICDNDYDDYGYRHSAVWNDYYTDYWNRLLAD